MLCLFGRLGGAVYQLYCSHFVICRYYVIYVAQNGFIVILMPIQLPHCVRNADNSEIHCLMLLTRHVFDSLSSMSKSAANASSFWNETHRLGHNRYFSVSCPVLSVMSIVWRGVDGLPLSDTFDDIDAPDGNNKNIVFGLKYRSLVTISLVS